MTTRKTVGITDGESRSSTRESLRRWRWPRAAMPVVSWLGVLVICVIWPIGGLVLAAPLYVWIMAGKGAERMQGAWPATVLLEDLDTVKGVRIFFGLWAAAHIALVSLLIFR